MKIKDFMKNSGFKVLALCNLSSHQYSIVLYLMNTAVSGLDNVVTNVKEIADILNLSESEINNALFALSDLNIIKIKYADKTSTTQENPSMCISINFSIQKWQIKKDSTPAQAAIVYPFKRGNLKSVDGDSPTSKKFNETENEEDATQQRVIKYFIKDRSLDTSELESTESAAKLLIETHPVDQILLLIKHFGHRIPTLSLLASSWQHFQETYFSEHHNIDLLSARKKHQDLDEQLRNSINSQLKNLKEELSEDELMVLEILNNHKHPRRQLFWAFQARAKYPKLTDFFNENYRIMLPVTNSGSIIKK